MTIRVYLRERTRTNPSGKRVATWALHWSTPSGKQCSKGLGPKRDMSKAQAKEARQRMEGDINEGREEVERGPGMTLDQFRAFYLPHRRRGDAPKLQQAIRSHKQLADGTIRIHDMALRYLIEFFGGSRRLDSITKLDGVAWHGAFAEGKLAGARSKKFRGRNGDGSPPAQNTIRSTTRAVKAIFSWARSNDMIRVDPFRDFLGTNVKGKDNPQVPLDHVRRLIEVSPQPWKALFALCRMAGLRRSEALSLPWSGTRTDYEGAEFPVGIDWSKKRIMLVGSDKAGTRFRVVPICPELFDILMATFEAAPEGTERIVHPITKNNADRDARKLIKAAGLTVWRKPYQSLRSSCENDWKLELPEATYCAFIGHSAEVSRKNYVAPVDAEFKLITG